MIWLCRQSPATQPEGWLQTSGTGFNIMLDSKCKHLQSTLLYKHYFCVNKTLEEVLYLFCLFHSAVSVTACWTRVVRMCPSSAAKEPCLEPERVQPVEKATCAVMHTHVSTFTTAHTHVVTEGQVNDSGLRKLSHLFCSLLRTKRSSPQGSHFCASTLPRSCAPCNYWHREGCSP